MCLCSRNCSSTFMARRLYYYYLLFVLSWKDKITNTRDHLSLERIHTHKLYNIYIHNVVLFEQSLQHVFFVPASVFRYTHATGRSENVFNGYLRNSIQKLFFIIMYIFFRIQVYDLCWSLGKLVNHANVSKTNLNNKTG